MAVETCEEIFTKWLTKKLKSHDVEDSVLAEYISGIVTSDDVDTDRKDVLKDIFEDLLQGIDTESLCTEILEEWTECQGRKIDTEVIAREMDLGERVSQIVGRSVQPVMKTANRSKEEEKIRQAILSRCCYTSDEDEECEAEDGATSHAASSPAPANQNAETVAAAERAKREKMKSESQTKKAADKVNREKQKAKQDERKEKERKRTQKGERRR